MNKQLFNIYYVNLSKVYELAMILNNRVLNSLTKEATLGNEETRNRKSKISSNYMNMFGAEIGEDNTSKKYQSSRVVETLEVKTTKSILLRNILDKCKKLDKKNREMLSKEECDSIFMTSTDTKLEIGDLVYIDGVSLNLENETELRAFKMLRNDAIKGMQYEGIDLNNLLNSILSDYSYTLTGHSKNLKEDVLLKIPMMYGSEFENLYTIDDLLIGQVALIGIYRGKTKKDDLKNSLQVFSNAELNNNNNTTFEFENSDKELKPANTKLSSENNANQQEYNFIDIISIIQNVNSDFSSDFAENAIFSKPTICRRILNWFKGNKDA